MAKYKAGLGTWMTAPPTVHDDRVLAFVEIDTSPSFYSRPAHPIVRINPTPSGGKILTIYDDPAFSDDPRANPLFAPPDTISNPPPYVSVEDLKPIVSTRNAPVVVTPPFASNEDPTTFASLFTGRSKQQETIPEPSPIEKLPRQRQKSTRRSPVRDLDKIDELDETDPFGARHHHHGPYQTANATLTGRKPSANRKGPVPQATHPIQRASQYVPKPIGAPIGIQPGQIMPKMPYQPPPPADYVSPAPTFGPLFPDPYPHEAQYAPSFNHAQTPDPRMQTSVPAVTRAPPFPIPQTSSRQSRYMAPSPMSQRHSLPSQSRPPMPTPNNHAHSAPDVQHTPSEPTRRSRRENPAAKSSLDRQSQLASEVQRTPSEPTRRSPRENAPPMPQPTHSAPEVQRIPSEPSRRAPRENVSPIPQPVRHANSAPEVQRMPSEPSRRVPRENAPPMPQPTHSAPEVERTPSNPRRVPRENNPPHRMSIPTPNIAPPLSVLTASSRTTSSRAPSSRSSLSRSSTAKSMYAPSHVPRKLVMPAPLQQQQQTTHDQPRYPPHMDDYHVPLQHHELPPLLMPRAEDIPMIQDERGARNLLRKKSAKRGTSPFPNAPPGITHSKSLGSSPAREQEPPVKQKKLGGLFRGSSGTGSKFGRKLSKKK